MRRNAALGRSCSVLSHSDLRRRKTKDAGPFESPASTDSATRQVENGIQSHTIVLVKLLSSYNLSHQHARLNARCTESDASLGWLPPIPCDSTSAPHVSCRGPMPAVGRLTSRRRCYGRIATSATRRVRVQGRRDLRGAIFDSGLHHATATVNKEESLVAAPRKAGGWVRPFYPHRALRAVSSPNEQPERLSI